MVAQVINDDCLQEAVMTRHTLKEQLDDEEATAENIMRIMTAKKGFLTTTDRFWRIEYSFWSSLLGASAESKIHEKVLECLPTVERPLTLQQADALFDKVENSKLVAFCGPALKTVVKTVRGYVTLMIGGRPPVLDRLMSNTVFTVAVKTRLALFCRVEISAGGSAEALKTGSEACNHKFQKLADAHDEGGILLYSDIVPVIIFDWLLSATDKQHLDRIKNSVVAKSGVRASAAPADKKGSKKGAIDTRAMVNALFVK
jgi:hypothetical protein